MTKPVNVETRHVTYLALAAATACGAGQDATRMLFGDLYDAGQFMPLVLACGIYEGYAVYSDDAADTLFTLTAALLEAEGRLLDDASIQQQVADGLARLAYYAAARLAVTEGVVRELPGHEEQSIFEVTRDWFEMTETGAARVDGLSDVALLPAVEA